MPYRYPHTGMAWDSESPRRTTARLFARVLEYSYTLIILSYHTLSFKYHFMLRYRRGASPSYTRVWGLVMRLTGTRVAEDIPYVRGAGIYRYALGHPYSTPIRLITNLHTQYYEIRGEKTPNFHFLRLKAQKHHHDVLSAKLAQESLCQGIVL
ncbi:hypothetical protein HOY82DRAFT_153856 [Tuber indicum]|nr:hypothetical protein HOY82DRAFT_153856 [Tuber indicum]